MSRFVKRLFPHFERRHGRILLGFYLVSVSLSLLVLLPGSISGHGDMLGRSVAAALGAFSGPFAGAIARGFQRCCWEFSLGLFPFCGVFLGGGLLMQMIPLPAWHQRTVRLTAWCLGLTGWFACIPVSFLHALD